MNIRTHNKSFERDFGSATLHQPPSTQRYRLKNMNITKREILSSIKIPSVICSLLLITALIHRLQLNSANYTTNFLIILEFIFLILLLLFIVTQLIYAIYVLLKKEWKPYIQATKTIKVRPARVQSPCVFRETSCA